MTAAKKSERILRFYGRHETRASRRRMTMERVKLIETDGEVALILPETILGRFGLREGDDIILLEEDGALRFDLTRPQGPA